jgi:hypothetical protein
LGVDGNAGADTVVVLATGNCGDREQGTVGGWEIIGMSEGECAPELTVDFFGWN